MGEGEKSINVKLFQKARAALCMSSPATWKFGFCPMGAEEPSAWSKGVAASYDCLREVLQVTGWWKHWRASGRMETKAGLLLQSRQEMMGWEKGTSILQNYLQ